jgi:hypothetical protein
MCSKTMSERHPNSKYTPQDVKTSDIGAKLAMHRKSILLFIYDQWGLKPQPCKPEYRDKWAEVRRATGSTWEEMKNEVTADWFGDQEWESTEFKGKKIEVKRWKWHKFVKGEHISWQQTLILLGIEKGVAGDNPKQITIRSGHGIGKSATVSWIVLWFLWCHFQAQVPVTAPTASQMHDVLWKELNIWIKRMKPEAAEVFEWQNGYIRVKYDSESWFARARTSTKENTEAIAGVHADHVLIAVDEASGVPEQVYNTAEGALTSDNVFLILISNPTQTMGYFYDSHHKNRHLFQSFHFDGEDAPLVDREYIIRQAWRHGRTSDEFKIRVQGTFPGEAVMDDSGYMQLIPETKIIVNPPIQGISDYGFIGRKILAVDPSGEGKDEITFAIRDMFKAKIIHSEPTSNPRKAAGQLITFMDRYNIDPRDVVVDAFGIGADIGKEVAIASKGKYNIYTVLLGNKPEYEEEYNGHYFTRQEDEMDEFQKDIMLNLRATGFMRLRKWLIGGAELLDDNTESSEVVHELVVIKYKRSLQGNQIQIMPKKEMKKLGIPSPNKADAIMLTMLRDFNSPKQSKEEKERIENEDNEVDDRFDVL